MAGLLLTAPSRWKYPATQHGWKVGVGFKQAAACSDPSQDACASELTSGVWKLCCVTTLGCIMCGRAKAKRLFSLITSSYSSLHITEKFAVEPVSAVSVVSYGDIWEVNEGLDNNGLIRVFVAFKGKNWFEMCRSYKKSIDMEYGIRESVYQITNCSGLSVVHEQMEGKQALNVT